ncbi:ChbG/HpnK family deacetylase [Granulicella cerasi]|uniref:ChbG/HpnK family deacetylase n=1 Tax=Granulicella cerasi TaxID=741063 RepID=A0ABW1ZFK7_9BACT
MSKRLILNADDFGLTHGINRAVEELHQAGALTSATLMANGPAFEDAVEIAQRNPGLGIGCHVVLTDGIPVSHPADIPTLLGPDGKTFRSSLVDFLLAVLRGRVSERDIAREAHAQITKLQRAGLDLTHVDTHKHTHTLPGVARPLLFVAERCRIGAIRSPFEQSWSLAVAHADPVRRLQVRLLQHLRKRFEALPQVRQGIVATSDGTLGISATGRLNHETLARLMETMPDGTGNWSATLATTTATSTPSLRVCGPRAKWSGTPCSPHLPTRRILRTRISSITERSGLSRACARSTSLSRTTATKPSSKRTRRPCASASPAIPPTAAPASSPPNSVLSSPRVGMRCTSSPTRSPFA